MMSSGGWLPSASDQILVEPLAVAVDDALGETLLDLLGPRLLGLLLLEAVGEERHEGVERIVALAAAIEDEVLSTTALGLADLVQGEDLAHVHDGGAEPALLRMVEEHRIEHLARRRIEAEGDVREAEQDLHLGQCRPDVLDRLQRREPELAVVVVPRADREGQGVDHQVRCRQAVAVAGEVVKALGHLELALDRLRHALLIDGERYDRSAETACELHARRSRRLAVLEVDRVEHALAAIELEGRLEYGELGRIEYEGGRDRVAHAAHHLGHLGDLVAADESGADVERVRALGHLLASHLDAALPVARLLEAAELPAAVRVAALADRKVGALLAQRDLAVKGGEARHPKRLAAPRHGPQGAPRPPPEHGIECSDMRLVAAAAAADDVDAVLLDEALEPLGHLLGREGIMGVAVDELGETGVGQHREQARPALSEPAHVLGHLLRAGRTIQAHHRHIEGMDHGRGRGDVGADE